MIELKFYRDDEYVYINNPDGTTQRVAVEDFESAISGEGGVGDNSIYSVHFSYNESNEIVCDKSYNDIVTAISNGKTILAVHKDSDGSKTGLFYAHVSTSNINFIFPRLVDLENGVINYDYIVMSDDGSLTPHYYYISFTLDD